MSLIQGITTTPPRPVTFVEDEGRKTRTKDLDEGRKILDEGRKIVDEGRKDEEGNDKRRRRRTEFMTKLTHKTVLYVLKIELI